MVILASGRTSGTTRWVRWLPNALFHSESHALLIPQRSCIPYAVVSKTGNRIEPQTVNTMNEFFNLLSLLLNIEITILRTEKDRYDLVFSMVLNKEIKTI